MSKSFTQFLALFIGGRLEELSDAERGAVAASLGVRWIRGIGNMGDDKTLMALGFEKKSTVRGWILREDDEREGFTTLPLFVAALKNKTTQRLVADELYTFLRKSDDAPPGVLAAALAALRAALQEKLFQGRRLETLGRRILPKYMESQNLAVKAAAYAAKFWHYHGTPEDGLILEALAHLGEFSRVYNHDLLAGSLLEAATDLLARQLSPWGYNVRILIEEDKQALFDACSAAGMALKDGSPAAASITMMKILTLDLTLDLKDLASKLEKQPPYHTIARRLFEPR